MKMHRSRVALLAAALGLSGGAEAQTPPVQGAAQEDAELESLLKILSEETAVATKTRMNGDYVPGIVTVLHGDELAALGARTVWDALSMVPGIEAVRDSSGFPSLTVRGIQFPFNSGNVKVLIDSMPAARDNAGINGMILDLPIQLVDRIEVIRGPGSVVYGDFAYMGLIHIVTRKKGAGVYARSEEGGNFSAGFRGAGRTKAGLDYSLSGSAFTGGPTEVPNRRETDDTRGFVLGSLAFRGLSLAGSLATREIEDRTALTPAVRGQQTHSVVEARYTRSFSKSAQLDVRLNNRESRFRSSSSDLDGNVLEGGVSLQWKAKRRHSWLFDASLTGFNTDHAAFRVPGPPPAPAPTPPPPGVTPTPPPAPPALPPLGFTLHDERLVFQSAMVQDNIEVSRKLALTLGARVDKYGDVDTRVTPRASLVFRATDRNILKVQYAEGFRAPTFFELYSRGLRFTDLDFEVNRTTEMNFVHRRPGMVLRLTSYLSRMDDLIFILGIDAQRHSIFDNARRARSLGIEGELEGEITSNLKALLNLSWLETRDSRNGDNRFIERNTVPGIMGNIALIAAPRPKTRFAARWHFVSRRGAAILPAYHELQATLTQKAFIAPGLDLRAGVRFSTGGGVLYPLVLPNSTSAVGYKFPKVFAEISWNR